MSSQSPTCSSTTQRMRSSYTLGCCRTLWWIIVHHNREWKCCETFLLVCNIGINMETTINNNITTTAIEGTSERKKQTAPSSKRGWRRISRTIYIGRATTHLKSTWQTQSSRTRYQRATPRCTRHSRKSSCNTTVAVHVLQPQQLQDRRPADKSRQNRQPPGLHPHRLFIYVKLVVIVSSFATNIY